MKTEPAGFKFGRLSSYQSIGARSMLKRDMRKRSSDNGTISREILSKKWTDWIDYWAVDFDYESKREIIQVEKNGDSDEMWTGNYPFKNEWQSFRTRHDRSLDLESVEDEYDKPGKYKTAVRVVDILGQDNLRVVTVKASSIVRSSSYQDFPPTHVSSRTWCSVPHLGTTILRPYRTCCPYRPGPQLVRQISDSSRLRQLPTLTFRPPLLSMKDFRRNGKN